MGFFGKIVATAINVATLPVAVAKDVIATGRRSQARSWTKSKTKHSRRRPPMTHPSERTERETCMSRRWRWVLFVLSTLVMETFLGIFLRHVGYADLIFAGWMLKIVFPFVMAVALFGPCNCSICRRGRS